MKFMKFILLFIFIYHLCFQYDAKAQWSSLDEKSQALLTYGIYQVHQEKYNDAICTFKKINECYPNYPIGYFLVAVVYQIIMRNYRVKIFEHEFEKYIDLAIKNGNSIIQQDKENSLNYFYSGGAYGYRGLHKVRKKEWLGAFFDGKKGIKYLKLALMKDAELYDAYYGLGTFHYWLGAKSKFIRYLFSYKGDQQQGIDELMLALKKGRYTNIECKYALAAIYYEEKNYNKAMEMNQELHELFPSNPACLYMRSRIFEKQCEWEDAKITMQQLLNQLNASEYNSVGYKVECHYRIAYYDYKMGNFELARNGCLKALKLQDKRNSKMELEGPLEDSQQILKQTNQLCEKVII